MCRISVVIPTRNREDLLRQAIASVQRQTAADWELLVCDDGSTDGTEAMVRERSRDDPRIRWLGGESEAAEGVSRGAPHQRNRGLAAAAGGVVLFLDSDDLLAPHALEQRSAAMENDASLDFVAAQGMAFTHRPGDRRELFNVMDRGEPLERFVSGDMIWGTPSVLWRKTSVERIGGWDASLRRLQDVELHTRALARGLRFATLENVDWYVRLVEGERVSRVKPDDGVIASDLHFFTRLRDELTATGHWNERFRRLLSSRAYYLVITYARRGAGERGRRLWRELEAAGIVTHRSRLALRLAATDWPGVARYPAMALQSLFLDRRLSRRRMLKAPSPPEQMERAKRVGAALGDSAVADPQRDRPPARSLRVLAVMRSTDAAVYKHFLPIARLEEVESITLVRPASFEHNHRLEKTRFVEVSAGSSPFRAWGTHRAVQRLARTQRFDVVLSFNPFPYGWIAHRAARRMRVPCHVGFVGTDWWKWASRRAVLRRWLGRIDAITCTGSSMKHDMIAHGIDSAKIRVLPHGIDVQGIDGAPKLDATYDAVFVGRLAAVKRVELILDAFAGVVRDRPDATLAIVGDGPEAQPLRDRVDALGLDRHVHFAGWVEDVTPWLTASKLVLLSSISEGLPFSLIEGMCCGCVPITTDVGDIGDHVRHEENGLLVPPDADAMAEAILDLLGNPERRQRMSERALGMRASFGYEAASNTWRELLAGPLKAPHSAP